MLTRLHIVAATVAGAAKVLVGMVVGVVKDALPHRCRHGAWKSIQKLQVSGIISTRRQGRPHGSYQATQLMMRRMTMKAAQVRASLLRLRLHGRPWNIRMRPVSGII